MKTKRTSFLPAILLLVTLSITNTVAMAQSHSSDKPEYKRPTAIPKGDMPPAFPDDINIIVNEITIYPPSLLEEDTGGTVTCKFTITEYGDTKNIKLLQKAHSLLNKEAIRIIRSFPRIRPAVRDGKPVPYEYELSIKFSPDAYRAYHRKRKEGMIKEIKQLESGNIFAESRFLCMPEFPGGQGMLLQYMQENIRYPESLKGSGISKRLTCSVDINIFGMVDNIKIIRGGNEYPEMDKEAIRLLSEMPAWAVGKNQARETTDWKFEDVPEGYNKRQHREYQIVKYTIPVTFKEDINKPAIVN